MRFLIKLLTCWIPGRKRRRAVRARLQTQWLSRELRRKARSVGKGLWCGGSVKVYCPAVELSDHVNFNGAFLTGRGRIRIGRYFHSGFGLTILSESHEYEGSAIPYDETFRIRDVEIGDFVWLGVNVTVLPGTRIGKGAIIQAGSVVHGTIPDYAIAGGNPAKVFAFRDKAHFDALEVAGAFH